MSERIIEVHNITPAAGWFFSDDEPVLCLALVTIYDKEYETLAPSKEIIALSKYEMGSGIISAEVTEKMRTIYYK